ncbi:hypothetical protein pneo_cds_504 [Pandoravirus neocaledonia]|uniref:Ankyrin repeat domain containing protein n=1 Tax=Pandoravirus neocaledonia TaxID=2107708 RepID=A0A2U7UCC0_9VIRU|nr:hypothetical protein pneo_cds_504 [Pandoravirus neocaledonia]AVK76111.1 hypothetical protein pneo_cds_504 [Pandoravirus neocaledonia]
MSQTMDVDQTSLSDVPAELLGHIARFLSRPADLASWRCATGFDTTAIIETVVLAKNIEIAILLCVGAPLGVVARSFACNGGLFLPEYAECVVKGGRVDVALFLVDDGTRATGDEAFRQRTARHGAILVEACRSGNAAIADALLARRWGLDHAMLPDIYMNASHAAARGGHLDTLALVHRASVQRFGCCHCDGVVMNQVLDLDAGHMAVWLHNHRAVFGTTHGVAHDIAKHLMVDILVNEYKLSLARWLIDVRPRTPEHERIADGISISAAEYGRADMVSFLHVTGLCACPIRALLAAAARGKINVLCWALGDPVAGADRVMNAPIASWDPSRVAYHAAKKKRADVLSWMLSRPDTHAAITTGVARCALRYGVDVDIVKDMHHRGLASFHRWDPLATVVRYGDLERIKAIIDAGAPYDAQAMCDAIAHRPADVVACLCGAYGTKCLQDAVDAVCGWDIKDRGVLWIRDNVRSVCVAQTLACENVDSGCLCRNCCP